MALPIPIGMSNLIGICFSNESKSGYVITLVAISYFIRKYKIHSKRP